MLRRGGITEICRRPTHFFNFFIIKLAFVIAILFLFLVHIYLVSMNMEEGSLHELLPLLCITQKRNSNFSGKSVVGLSF